MNAAVLLDSGAFIALADPEDAHHQPAVSFLSSLKGPAYTLHSILALAWLRSRPQVRHVFGFDEHWRIEGHLLVPG